MDTLRDIKQYTLETSYESMLCSLESVVRTPENTRLSRPIPCAQVPTFAILRLVNLNDQPSFKP
jgi:hypothetical protein